MVNDDTDKQTPEAGGEAKKNWRERLGINKDLPKIAAEFREERRTSPARPAAGTTRLAERPDVSDATGEQPRAGQPIARPAPMAPRPSSLKPPLPSRPEMAGEEAPASPATSNEPKPAMNEPKPAPREPDIDDFSARLRAQREAAERLAQQRLAASRQTGAAMAPLVPDDASSDLADAGGDTDTPVKPSPAITRDKPAAPPPKFTFAPAELGRDETTQVDLPHEPEPGPEPPARQRPVRREPPPLRTEPAAPAAARPEPERPQVQPTAAALATPPLRNSVAPDYQARGRRGMADAGQGNVPPLQTAPQQRPPAAAPPPPRQPSWAPPKADGQVPPLRSPRAPSIDDDDLEDVFEDAARSRGSQARARIDDYNAAYRDFDEGLEDDEDERRSGSGPIVLILALLTVAAIAGALVYFYRANTPQTAGGQEEVPVITAPDEPVKTEPDQAAQPAQPAEPVGRKQIYDRILGEETLEPETVVPSEEVPQAPGVDEVPAVEGSSDAEVEPLPLPLPPPPGTGEQGSLQTPGSGQNAGSTTVSPTGVAGTTARSDQQAVPSSQSNSTTLAALPPPEPLAEAAGTAATAATTSAPAAASEVTSATQSTIEQATQTVASRLTPPKPRPKPRRRVAAVTQTQTQTAPAPQPSQSTVSSSSSGPVALTPGETAPAGTDNQSSFSLPNLLQGAGSGRTTRRTGGPAGDDDPLAGLRAPINSGSGTATSGAQQLTALQPQQVAPAPEPAPAPTLQPAPQPTQPAPALVAPSQPATQTQTAPTGSGYVVQLASYRSQAEAQNEYQRLKARHGGLLGNLPPSIQKAELGAAGTYYRLGVGPLNSKQSASNLCNSLIAAGEKDCLVRRQ